MDKMFEFSRANLALLELIKIGIGTSKKDFDFSALDAEEWQCVYSECQKQAISLLCFEGLKGFENYVPENIYSKWVNYCLIKTVLNMKILESQNILVKILASKNIDYLILKGASSASYYPNPELRCFGDIDFLIDIKNWDIVKQYFIDNGYRVSNDEHYYHSTFVKGYSVFEMHKQIGGIPNGPQGDAISAYISNALERYELVGEPHFRKPDDALHGIIIVLHTVHHLLSKGLGLRHLCDWACFVKNTHKMHFWQNELLVKFKDFGIYKFVSELTYVSVKYLGIDKPEWLVEYSDEFADELFGIFFKSGNFGSKNVHMAKSYGMFYKGDINLTLCKKTINMIRALNETNEKLYPVLKKVKVFYPFIMIWRVLKYLLLQVQGKRPSLIKVSRYTDLKNEFYLKWKLFTTDEKQ